MGIRGMEKSPVEGKDMVFISWIAQLMLGTISS